MKDTPQHLEKVSDFAPVLPAVAEESTTGEQKGTKKIITNKPFVTKKAKIEKTNDTFTHSQEKFRYSDADLLKFKEIILQKIEKAKEDLILFKSAYSVTLENGTDDTGANNKDTEENGLNKATNNQLVTRQEKFLRDLQNALFRVENKTYGVCKVTGKLISKERLQIVPHCTESIEAKNMQDQISA